MGYIGHIVALQYFFSEVQVVNRALALCIVQDSRFANAGRFTQPGVSVDDGIKDHFFKMQPHFIYYLVTEPQPAIVHGHQYPFYHQLRIQPALNDFDGI